MLHLTFLAVLLAAATVADFAILPFPTYVIFHPRGRPEYCLAYETTKNSYPYEFRLRM